MNPPLHNVLRSVFLPSRPDRYLLIVLLMFLLAQCLYFALDNGQTVDETFYNGSGYPIVRYNNYNILGEHPPLMMQWASLPLLLLQPHYPTDNPIYVENSHAFKITEMGSRFLYEMGNNAYLILFLERLMIILLTVLLGFFIYQWASELYGSQGGLWAVLLYAFCPNMVAHGSQFTTDMGITFFFFLTFYRLKKFFEMPTERNLILIGLTTGGALMSKISALVLFPIIFLLFVYHFFKISRYQEANSLTTVTRRSPFSLSLSLLMILFSLGAKLIFVILGPLSLIQISIDALEKSNFRKRFEWKLIAILAGYILCFIFLFSIAKKRPGPVAISACFWVLSIFCLNLYLFLNPKSSDKRLYRLIETFSMIWLIAALVIVVGYTDFLNSFAHGKPFYHYLKTFDVAASHSLGGHDANVSGSFIRSGWTYFLFTMAVKTPLFTSLLFLLGAVLMLNSKSSERSFDKFLIFIPPLIFFCVASFVNKIYIGIRHILPIYPFIFLIAGAAASKLWNLNRPKLKLLSKAIVMIGCIAFIFRSLQILPHNLSYFNEWVGDEAAGSRFLRVNAGQDNKRLAELVRKLGISSIKIATTSTNEAEYRYHGMNWTPMTESDYENPTPGFYAMDLEVYNLQQYNPDSSFRNRKPDYIAGKIFYLFRI